MELESKYDYISGYVCIACGQINVPLLTGGWVEPLCEACYNKRIDMQRRWHEKNHKDWDFTYTPYDNLEKSDQKIMMIATYKCYSAERRDYEKKCDYTDTIKMIMERQKKLFASGRVK